MAGGYRYNVTWNGECIVSLSRDPETDLARAVLARGIKGVVTVLDGKTGKPRIQVYIERAAKLRTVETGNAPRFRKETCADGPYAGESTIPGREGPTNDLGRVCTADDTSSPQENFPTADADHRSEAA